MSTLPVLVLGIHLEYLVYLSTWSTVLDPNPGIFGKTLFLTSNGVKQGGILSPILFNGYTDHMGVRVNASNNLRNISGKLITHLCYAAYICLISLHSVVM